MADTKVGPGFVVGAVAYLLALVGLCVALSVAAGSPWPGLLCFVGLMTIQVVASRALEQKFGGAFVAMWLGAWAISAAGTLAEYAGQWLWSAPWVLAGLLLLGVGRASRGVDSWTSPGGFLLGIWSLAWAFVGPVWLYGMDQQETQEWMLDIGRQWWWALLIGVLLVSALVAWLSSAPQRPVRPRPARPKTPAPPAPGPGAGDHADFERMLREIEEQVRRDEEQRERDRQQLERAGGGRAAPESDDGPPGARPRGPVLESGPPAFGATVLATEASEGTPPVPFGHETAPSAPLEGDLLYSARHPVVDAALTPGGVHYLLFEDGTMARWHGGTLDAVPDASVERPVGLAAVESDVVVAGRSGGLGEVRNADRGLPDITWHRLDLSVGAFAFNPFGTIVAFAPVRRHDVFALLLGPDTTQTLAAEVGAVRALAFSDDGRVLAMGLRDGSVVLLDMSTRQPMATLEPPGEKPVTVLQPSPDGGWLAGYEDGWVARWDDAHHRVGATRLSHAVTRIAVGSSEVAIGCDDGHVVTQPADLSGPRSDSHVTDGSVVGLAVEPGDGSFLVVGHDGAVRRAAA